MDQMSQMNLFDGPSLNIILKLKMAMRMSLKQSNLSRDQIAERMTETMRAEGLKCPGNSAGVSKAILDKWVSESSAHVISVGLLPAFCFITNSWLAIQVLAASVGATVISEEDRRLLLWAEAEVQKRHIQKKVRKLAEEIGI